MGKTLQSRVCMYRKRFEEVSLVAKRWESRATHDTEPGSHQRNVLEKHGRGVVGVS
jgi:hypothetical protein